MKLFFFFYIQKEIPFRTPLSHLIGNLIKTPLSQNEKYPKTY